METKAKKISDKEWLLTISRDSKPIFQTRIYKVHGFYCNDHNCQEFKTLEKIKGYFSENLNDFLPVKKDVDYGRHNTIDWMIR